MKKPTIIVVAYNRANSLKRLLSSLDKAKYPENVNLIISIDKGDNSVVQNVAKNYNWTFGEKKIIYQEKHLGLKNHILKCGDLTKKYEEIILLEDDLYVSPHFYKYAAEALDFFNNDNNIAGISLYSISHNILTNLPFLSIPDESDIFFLQIPESWGQAWNRVQWFNFRNWFKSSNFDSSFEKNYPRPILMWPESSWTKYFWKYMIETDKYFVYPRESFTTNFCDVGTHRKKKITLYQVPLQLYKDKYIFKDLNHSIAVYDPFFEILPERLNRITKELNGYNYATDLYGSKDLNQVKADYLLTSKKCRKSILSFGKELKPFEMNIIEGIKGNAFFLCKKESIRENRLAKHFRWQKNFFFFNGDLSIKTLIFLLLRKGFR